MINVIKSQLIDGFNVENNPFLYRRLILTSALLFIGMFSFTIFAFVNYFKQKYTLVTLDICVSMLTAAAVYFLFVKKRIEYAAIISTSMLFVLLLFFTYITKNNGFGLVWTLCYPLFVIPILGARKGLWMIVLFYLILVPIAYLGIGEWDHGFWDKTSFLRFCMASLTIVYIAYFYETSTQEAFQTILEIREKEKKYLSKLKRLSTTDQLTGLHNRRYFDDHYELERQKVQRYNNELCLIMIDIDHFKLVNDKYGHQVGDKVLIEFSLLLRKNIRNTDILARWGGEEFIILLPETSIENCLIIAEKIRKAIDARVFSEIDHLTASFGISKVGGESDSNIIAIHSADAALFQAKRDGRNRVVMSQI